MVRSTFHFRRRLAALGLLLLATSLAPAAEPREATTRPVDGTAFSARLKTIDSDWKIVLIAGDVERSLAAGDLVMWGTPAEPLGGDQLLLADGGVLVADVIETAGDDLVFYSEAVGKAEISLERLSGILFRAPTDPQRRDRLAAKVRKTEGDADRVLLQNGDTLSGTLRGVVEEKVGQPLLEFDTGAAVIKIEVKKVRAVAFNPNLIDRRKPRGLHALVGFSDGGRVLAQSLTVGEKESKLSLPGGIEWPLDRDELIFLQPIGGKVTYLSDLKPANYRHAPYLTLAWPYRNDRNVLGTQLRAGKQLFCKGIGLHSAAQLTYVLDQPYRRLEAELAIDGVVGRRGAVTFRVVTYHRQDGKTVRREAFASKVIRGGAEPVALSVDLTGVRGVSLIVDFSERGDELDHANWLSARLVK